MCGNHSRSEQDLPVSSENPPLSAPFPKNRTFRFYAHFANFSAESTNFSTDFKGFLTQRFAVDNCFGMCYLCGTDFKFQNYVPTTRQYHLFHLPVG